MGRIDVIKLYESRVEEIDMQIRTMARSKKWKNYNILKEERKRLKAIIESKK